MYTELLEITSNPKFAKYRASDEIPRTTNRLHISDIIHGIGLRLNWKYRKFAALLERTYSEGIEAVCVALDPFVPMIENWRITCLQST
jgi:hypothetical protein